MADGSPTQVEYRLLQLITNVYGDERRTAVLLHWDGRSLRTAWNNGHVPSSFGPAREGIKATLRNVVRRAQKLCGPFPPGTKLDDILPVAAGEGLHFTCQPKRIGYTRDPAVHFAELAENLGLTVVKVRS